ncbi:EscV/YscV/HrcV family type III secretion system export apparatus protein [Candidatus Marinamargulisbacteria bacterium SCGC AG-414-C22]|nr:EscV/YscV/HrcV family type III secretion system export apparatus protein [Candidatus Marinamargulisbacteria bacterium SCGC AG-414-C22]
MVNFNQVKELFSPADVILAVVVILIIALMVVPIPSFVLDLLMTFNVATSIMVLLVAMYLSQPLDFAAFPSMLLILTLFRLSLNVASTKLILSKGADFDGQLIEAFAEFVTAGNFVVGIVAFVIITLVQFMVVTKGSERVAEVAARFTLDALPGKQMSIDADLNAGLLDADQARERRENLSKESNFFGSMDGANKFVKGDAIAGIIIVIINIVGGLIIGSMQQGMALGDAFNTFSRFTVGDGLVSQLPALLISIATGLVVTKSASNESLGSDVKEQIFSQPKAFAVTSFVLLLVAMVPGLPTVPFISLAIFTGVMSFYILKSRSQASDMSLDSSQESAKDAMKKPENLLGTLSLDPISLKSGRNLVPLIDPNQNGPLLERITLVRYHIGQELGFVIPGVRVMDDLSLEANQYLVDIRGTRVATGEALPGHVYVHRPTTELSRLGLDSIEAQDPILNDAGSWVSEDQVPVLQENSIPFSNVTDFISDHFSESIKQHADEIMIRQNVQSLLELVKNTNAAIVRELVPDMLSLGQVHKVLQTLVRERVSIRDLSTILEKLADYAHVSRDTNLLAEYVRQALARQISRQYVDKDDSLTVFTIDPRLEETMINSVHQSEYGSFLALDPQVGEVVLNQVSEFMSTFKKMDKPFVSLCSPRLRTHFKKFTERNHPVLAVLSYNEVISQVKVQSIGVVKTG